MIAELFDHYKSLPNIPRAEIISLVRQDAIKLTETITHYDSQLKQLRERAGHSIDIAVKDINDIIVNIRI